jgi:hypothetical protein
MSEVALIGAPQSNFVRTARIACVGKGFLYMLDPAAIHFQRLTPEGHEAINASSAIEAWRGRATARPSVRRALPPPIPGRS